jgi:hypothetical protein
MKQMCGGVKRAIAVLALFAGVSAPVYAGEQATPERCRIRGMVVDAADGHVLSRARVTIVLLGGDTFARSVLTGDDGRFDFADLAAGKYELAARRWGYATRKYLQHGDFASAIVAGPGRDTEKIRFALTPGAVISGVVRDESGEALRHAWVKLITRDLRDGRLTSDLGLNAGTYLIAVEASPWYAQRDGPHFSRADASQDPRAEKQSAEQNDGADLDVAYPTTYFGNATDKDAAAPIEVKAGDAAVADVSLQPVPAARLRVLTDGNHGILSWRGGQTGFSSIGRDDTGQQVVTIAGLPPGPAQLVVTDHATETDDGMNLELVRTKTIVISGDTEVTVPVEGEGATISGTVDLYRPAASTRVVELEIRGAGGTQTDVASVSQDGKFKFSSGRFAAGEYEVVVREPPGAVVVGITASGATMAAQKLLIGAETDVRLAVTVAVGSTRVRGVVAKEGGVGAAGVMMLLVPLDFGGPVGLYRRDESASDGSFEFENVAEGNYLAVGMAVGWELEWGKAEVLGKYLARGTKVVVGPVGLSGVHVDVQ